MQRDLYHYRIFFGRKLMIAVRSVIAVILLVVAATVAVLNWIYTISRLSRKRMGANRPGSTIPVVTVVLTALAYTAYPGHGKLWMACIPMCDIGNWWLLALPVIAIRSNRKRKSSGKRED
jgi:hypothetical protein